MQVIDSTQSRTAERLKPSQMLAWEPVNFDKLCADHIRYLIEKTRPDLILITGDVVYGEFDDLGSTLEWFCALMDSFEIPWAPVFGNHDNSSKKGVAWQCECFKKSAFCLFERGCVSGNGNYSIGISVGDSLVRVIHMLDSNGCHDTEDTSVIKRAGLYEDQLKLVSATNDAVKLAAKRDVPAFMAFHIPVSSFRTAESVKGYLTAERELYTLGEDVPALDEDFGSKLEKYHPIEVGEEFIDLLKTLGVEAVFVGHEHNNSTCIGYRGIKWVFGLKTGEYDYHLPGKIGGTLITLLGESFSLGHVISHTE